MKDSGCLSFNIIESVFRPQSREGELRQSLKNSLRQWSWESRETKVVQGQKTVQCRKKLLRESQRSTEASSSRIPPGTDHIYLCEETTWGLGKKHVKQLKVTFSDGLKGIELIPARNTGKLPNLGKIE